MPIQFYLCEKGKLYKKNACSDGGRNTIKGTARLDMPNQIMSFFFSFYKPSYQKCLFSLKSNYVFFFLFANHHTKMVFFPLKSARFCYHETAPRGSLLFLISEGILWTQCVCSLQTIFAGLSLNIQKNDMQQTGRHLKCVSARH